MRVQVTGASGFLGAYVVRRLVHGGHDVMALARSRTAERAAAVAGATPVSGDLEDVDSLGNFLSLRSPEVLVNLASLGFGHAPNIVAAAERAGLERAIFISTTAIFTSLPAPSKQVRVAAEATITGSSLRWTILRPTMIYGAPGDRNMARLLQVLRRTPAFPLPGGGRRLQQPVHVDDLAQAVVACLSRTCPLETAYNLPGPEPLTLRSIVEEAGRAVGRHPVLFPVPLRPVIRGVQVYERLSARPRLRVEQLERLAEDKAFDAKPAGADLDFRPRPFPVGIREEAAMLS